MPPLDVVQDPEKFRAWLHEQMQPRHHGYSHGVPEGLREGLIRYIVDHIPTGSFLLAVLTNDLKEACGRADEENKYRLFDLVYFLHNFAPSACWGSKDQVRAWLEIRTREESDSIVAACARCEWTAREAIDADIVSPAERVAVHTRLRQALVDHVDREHPE